MINRDPAPSTGRKAPRLKPSWSAYFAVLGAILVLSIAYYFAIALPGYERQKVNLEAAKFQAIQAEKENARLDAITKQLDADALAEARKQDLEAALVAAEQTYWEYVKLNGGKPVKGKPGVMTAPQYVWDRANKQLEAEKKEAYRKYAPAR